MLSAKNEKNIMRYVDELSGKMELEGAERKEFEEEMFENLKISINELMEGGLTEDEAIKVAINRFGEDHFEAYGKEKKNREDVEDMPAKLFSYVMSLLIAVVAVSIFVPGPVKYLAILGIVSGLGYAIISLLTKNK